MTYRQKMVRIRNRPKLSRFILIPKVTSVAFFAIGLGGLVSWSQPGRPSIGVLVDRSAETRLREVVLEALIPP